LLPTGLEIPPFLLQRRLVIETHLSKDQTAWEVRAAGVDVDDTPVSFIEALDVSVEGTKETKRINEYKEQFFTKVVCCAQ
jgi:hypothetical protein